MGGGRPARGDRAAGVLLLAFPLVPPDARNDADKHARALAARRPELTAPSKLGLPTVVAQGARDPFGTAAELRDVLRRTRGAEVVEVPGADHGLRTARNGPDPAPVLLQAALRAVALARGE